MLQVDPNNIIIKDLHHYLLSIVGPRPIALASTINQNGISNVSPFSFFNIFSANPPIAIFSPARRVRNNTEKDTLKNIESTKEVVINIVNYNLVEKASIASNEYPQEIDEFFKAGLTKIESKKIKPYRVEESPVQMECKVNQIINLGKEGGAGNLIICEILLIHISETILNEKNEIDQNKIQLVGRMGGDWYCKGFKESLFEIQKPTQDLCIGFDSIPKSIQNSNILNEKDLIKLASISELPGKEELKSFSQNIQFSNTEKEKELTTILHTKAKEEINNNNIKLAWKYLLINNTKKQT
tara:strand:- start:2484 stop:3377 length:894 start_codon:yes stop_codon:yes gene_type:complete